MEQRPRVGEILVAAGIIDDMQLESALCEQSRWGRRLGVTLIKLGMVEEGHLIRALAKQLDLPVASLAGKKIPDRVINLVPASVAFEHGVLPLFTKEEGLSGQLFLGMEDPSNIAVLEDLSFRTGMEIHPVMVGPSELGEAIDRYYRGRSEEDPPPPEPPYQAEPMSAGSLRIVTDDSAQPGTVPAEPAEAGLPPLRPQPGAAAAAKNEPIELSDAPVQLPDGLVEDVARAVEETERTRIVAKAIAQLLIEKGLLDLEDVQSAIARLRTVEALGDGPGASEERASAPNA